MINDHSRVAYVEICADEQAYTAIGVLPRAVAWFAEHGVTVERVLSDNGAAYRSNAWCDACTELGITPKRTRPYRPQTNGKIERFHRTLADGWTTPGSIPQTPNAEPLSPGGSTSTITTESTARSETSHPSAGWTTSPDITSRSRRKGPHIG